MKAAAKEGDLDAIESEYFIKYYNTFKNIAKDYQPRPDDLEEDKIGLWYWGATGAGKSRAAYDEFPDAYRKIANNKWWDGYQGEDAVILDDLDKKHEYMGYHLKIWADRYAFIAETKGSSRMIRPKRLVVTSNYHPNMIWTDETTLGPILRRFKVVRFLTFPESINQEENEEQRLHFSVRQLLEPTPVPTPSPEPVSFLSNDDLF